MDKGYSEFLLKISYLKKYIKSLTLCKIKLHKWGPWEEYDFHQDSFFRNCENCLTHQGEERPNPHVDAERDKDKICDSCNNPVHKHMFRKYHDTGKVILCPNGKDSDYPEWGFEENNWRALHRVKLMEGN